MKKLKLLALAATAFIAVFAGGIGTGAVAASAETAAPVVQTATMAETRGLYVNISLTLQSDGDRICAIAKNHFTLFPSTVEVYIYLYFSEEEPDSYEDMTMPAMTYIPDLDQGESQMAMARTNGRTGWWLARLRYQRDSSGWKELQTDAFLYDGDGNLL